MEYTFIDVGTPYDLKSIMHYPKSNKLKPLHKSNKIELSENLSETDVIEIRRAYKCSGCDWKWLKKSESQLGGKISPRIQSQ